MSEKTDSTQPIPNDEKFKPQNVADPVSSKSPPSRDATRPADTDGDDVARGSEPTRRDAGKTGR